ncbi:spliceosome-associated protein CWC27 homolog isoform X2 [Salmo salar]|uniref:Peptidyl-prolyl cis-trans isomerase n=1 Tax=Salmo salar TaxID=8030 RepID=A0ABM3CPG7_SALSA|nr:spliceosome-associated protein CWC27 homolog isoform X2 [Salmo salar]
MSNIYIQEPPSNGKDEFHSRLHFNRRGLVAMANAGPHDNGSQFFFTLGRADELNNKHTIFGKVTGDTMYNMLRLAEVKCDQEKRPLNPHKLRTTERRASSRGSLVEEGPTGHQKEKRRPRQSSTEGGGKMRRKISRVARRWRNIWSARRNMRKQTEEGIQQKDADDGAAGPFQVQAVFSHP